MTESGRSAMSGSPAFWNVNVPLGDRTATCPAFLRYCIDGGKDREIIGTPDAAYRRLTWEEVRDNVAKKRLDLFQRTPSDLRKYRHFCYTIEGQYGSVLAFIKQERLRWEDVVADSDDFDADNYKILFNDWPYGVDKRIVHLVVWTKFTMAEDPHSGLLLPEMQRKVDRFVEETFVKRCTPDSVVWFRNWTSLKSVHALEHIHVMLLAPTASLVEELTGGDCPLAVKLGYIEA